MNCAVLRPDRRMAFDVNVLGTYNAVAAAAAAGHRRFINSGPHFSLLGCASSSVWHLWQLNRHFVLGLRCAESAPEKVPNQHLFDPHLLGAMNRPTVIAPHPPR